MAHHVDVGGGTPGQHRPAPGAGPGGPDHPAGADHARRRGGPDGPRDDHPERPLAAGDGGRPAGPAGERDRRAAATAGAHRGARARGRVAAGIEDLLAYTRRRSDGGRSRSCRRAPSRRRTSSTTTAWAASRSGSTRTHHHRRGPGHVRPDRDGRPATVVHQHHQGRGAVGLRLCPALHHRPGHPRERRLLPGHRAGRPGRRPCSTRGARRPSGAARTPSAGCARPPSGPSPGSCRGSPRPTPRARMLNISFGGVNPRTGDYFVYYETQAGGYGGRDGHRRHGRRPAPRPEHRERAHRGDRGELPGRVPAIRARVRTPEGPGTWRGGLGLRRDYVFEGPVTFTVMSERVRFAPRGLAGGGDARSNHYIRDPEGEAIRYPSKFSDRPCGRRGHEHPERGRWRLRRGRAAGSRRRSRRTSRPVGSARSGRATCTASGGRADERGYRVAIDIGGTFTDVAHRRRRGRRAVDRQGPVDAGRPVDGLLRGARPGGGRRPGSGSADCRAFLHATTVATNAVITRTGGPAALIATEGFRDVLEIARQIRHDLYDLRTTKPRAARAPPVGARGARAAALRRVGAGRRWTRPRSAPVAERLRDSAIRSVAVCLLHAYLDPAHERRVCAILRGGRSPTSRCRCRATSRPRSASTRGPARRRPTRTSGPVVGRVRRARSGPGSWTAARRAACG